MANSLEGTPDSASPWEVAAYPAAEVARLVRLSAGRVRRWLEGYDYRYRAEIRHQRPVIHRARTAGTSCASFLDLVDLLFVKQFLDHGLSLQMVRKALDEAAEILGMHHFARQSFFTDGANIYLQVKEQGNAILELLSRGQWVIPEIILQLADQIDFHRATGLAERWYPMGPQGLVVLDPLVSFGRPSVVGKGVTTANVYDLFVAEGRKARRVSPWTGLTLQEVEAAVQFEGRLAA